MIRPVALTALLLVLAGFALSAPITYDISVNTSSISGTTGSLDFNFNPGPGSVQAASLQILNFLSDGTPVGSRSLIGDASGTLPGPLTFDNGTALNDYFQAFQYGSTMSFDVSLFGPALATPNGTATAGSTFVFSMFSDPAGTVPALTSDTVNGFAFTINVNLDGTTKAKSFSPNIVPEPGTLGLALVGILVVLGLRIKRFARS
jgi:hypothetical protein